jgi:hypothetical protein
MILKSRENERRLFVPEIDVSYAQNDEYFNPLIEAINDGGAEMLLAPFVIPIREKLDTAQTRKNPRIGKNATCKPEPSSPSDV